MDKGGNRGGCLAENKQGRICVAELAYLLYFTVMFGARAIGLFEGMTVYNISLVAGMALFLVKVMMTEHTVLEYLLMGCLLSVALIVYYNTGEKGLLLYLTMMLGMKNVWVRRVFKAGTVILGTAFPVLVLLSITGLKEEIIYIKGRAFFGEVIRHSLGYPYPNTLFTTYIVLMVLVMYMLGKQSKKNLLLSSLFLLIGALYIYIYSCSNTGLIVSVFYLALNLYLQLRPAFRKAEKAGILLVYPGCLVFSILGPLAVRGSIFQIFDRVLHNRFAYSLYYLTNEPVTLFGVRFREAPNTNYMIDSSFLYSFLQIGVVPFLIVTLLFMWMICDYVKQEKKTELALIVAFCVLGLSDPFLFNLSYKNLAFLFIGEMFYRKLQALEARAALNGESILFKKIQWLSVGNRVLFFDKGIYRWCKEKLRSVGELISKNNGWLSLVYLLSAAVITGVLYVTTCAGRIVGSVDQVEEWEWVRNALSFGIWGGVLIAGGLLVILQGRSTDGS